MAGIGAIGASGVMSGYYTMYQNRLAAGRRQAYYAADVSAARSAAVNPAQPELPVEPVSPVRRVSPDAAVRMPVAVQEPRLPTADDLNTAAETLARMRVRYPGGTEIADGQAAAQAFNTNLMNDAGIS